MTNYLLAGGGTAGHVNPLLALADYIRANGAVRVAASTGLGRADETGAVARRATATIYYK